MNLTEFREAVMASQVNEHWFELPVRVSDKDVAKIERKLGVVFPPDFRVVLGEYGCGQFHYVELLEADPKAETGLLQTNLDLRGEGISGFIAVSSNGCGDYYGFKAVNGVCSDAVYFYDHETGEISDAPVAESILNYLRDKALVLSSDLHLLATGRAHLVNKWWWW